MKFNFSDLVQKEYNVTPNRFIVYTEDGTILKNDEEVSVGSVINFSSSQVIKMGEPKKVGNFNPKVFQGFVEDQYVPNHEWDENTPLYDIYYSMLGTPIPVKLLAMLVHSMLKS